MLRWIGAVVCAIVLTACTRTPDAGTAASSAAAPPASGGVLRVGTQRSPNTLNPILAANTTEAFIDRLTSDTLVSVSADGKQIVPILATVVPTQANGGISKDGLTITYHLHPDVKWQDGEPFTSHDVSFTWRAIMSNANNVISRNGFDQIASVDTPDATTVVFHLKRTYAPFVDSIFGESDSPYEIIPEHLLGKFPNINRVPFNDMPIGTGPYRVTKWLHGDRVELVANDDYFRGKPHIKHIVVRDIPDENTSINALRSHDIDWMFEASPETVKALKPLDAAGTIHITYVKMPQTLPVWINMSRPYLKDVRVREALAYAIDKKALVERLTGGTAVVATADQPSFSPYYNSKLTNYPLDVAKAKSLLTAAGYTYDSDGYAVKHGQRFALQISYNVENATRRAVSVQLQAMLKAIGIDASIKAYPANLYFATLGQGGILTNAKYDIGVTGWIAGYDPDDNSLWGCEQFPPVGNNYSRYCSPEMTVLQREALGTYDEATRKKAYLAIQELLMRDLPVIEIWYPVMLQPINPAFKNFHPNPISEAWQAHEWEL